MGALELARRGEIDYHVFVFSNVGKDSEHPDTLDYFYNVAQPYAKRHGLELIEVHRESNNSETLYQRLLREERSVRIPIRMPNGAPGTRSCTKDFKISVIRRWMDAYEPKGIHTVGLGISLDEFQRMRDSGHKRFTNDYPLIALRLKRSDCVRAIQDAGLPVPPKSSCWFCPFHSVAVWRDMKRQRPDLFEKSIELEQVLNDKRHALGRDSVYLTRFGKPLSEVIAADQLVLFDDDDACESGYCMT